MGSPFAGIGLTIDQANAQAVRFGTPVVPPPAPTGPTKNAVATTAGITKEKKKDPRGRVEASSHNKRLYDRGIDESRRFPMVFTTTSWWHFQNRRAITLWVNPKEVSWTFTRRESYTKTAAGVTRNAWRNRFRNTYYDEGTINITFQSGNLMPGATIPDQAFLGTDGQYSSASAATLGQYPPIPKGLLDFYSFMEAIDQQYVIGSQENRHILYYHSRIFPKMRIEGYIDASGVTWPDSSENGNQFNWTVKMHVYRTSPRINSSAQLMAAYWAFRRNTGINREGFPNQVVVPGYTLANATSGETIKDTSTLYPELKPVQASAPSTLTPNSVVTSTALTGASEPPDSVTQAQLNAALDTLDSFVPALSPDTARRYEATLKRWMSDNPGATGMEFQVAARDAVIWLLPELGPNSQGDYPTDSFEYNGDPNTATYGGRNLNDAFHLPKAPPTALTLGRDDS